MFYMTVLLTNGNYTRNIFVCREKHSFLTEKGIIFLDYVFLNETVIIIPK